ncbi:hypothetical protein [Micromonospora sp. NPDC048898]|uniref:hypothetical protein n=1 Tax=Micromonospora sp. NPDC048898 TaxID=3364260 RepID=UPI00371702D2
MRIAFNFSESRVCSDAWSKQRELEKVLIGHLIETVPAHRRHFRILAGSVPGHRLYDMPSVDLLRAAKTLAYHLVTAEGSGTWRTVDKVSAYENSLMQNDLLALVVEGVSYHDASRIDKELNHLDGYLGALQVQLTSEAHFSFYTDALPYRYRLHESSLWVLHGAEYDPAESGEDNRNHELLGDIAQHFRGGPIKTVEFQSIGMRDTVFDPYGGFDYAEAEGRTEAMLLAYHGAMVDDLLIRLREADPQLIQALHAAFEALDQHDSIEQRSHVALSSRRFLERLANVLYPPTGNATGERKLGKAQYRNRLWKYAEERLEVDERAKVALASLQHVGSRIDALDKAANKGVHDDVETFEMHRLVMGVFLLAHDLLTLRSPDGRAAESYASKIEKEMFKMLRDVSEG